MEGLIAINGEMISPDLAKISAFDRGFLFGDSIFEVMVGFRKKILNQKSHLKRLRFSAHQYSIPIPWTDEQLLFEIETLNEQLNAPKSYIRLVVTRGEGLGLKTSSSLTPNRLIYALPAKKENEKSYAEGLALKTKHLPFTDRGAKAKTSNYLRSINALTQAEKSGYQDILWINADQEITEASTANIFLIGRDGDKVEIATPPEHSGILLGITRAKIIELLTRSKIPVTERIIYSDEIPRYDEAFICSTVRGLIPICKIDDHKLHTIRRNSIFKHIERLYLTWAESEIGYRVDWNTGIKEED